MRGRSCIPLLLPPSSEIVFQNFSETKAKAAFKRCKSRKKSNRKPGTVHKFQVQAMESDNGKTEKMAVKLSQSRKEGI